jgi:glycosyltransferase involved in cell wall biosynthesis
VRIAVDGFEMNRSFTGVGRYLHNLLEAMLQIDKKNHYTLFLGEAPGGNLSADNLEKKTLPTGKSYTRWQNIELIRALKNGRFDLFFSPNHSIPLLYKGRSFLTLHDISWRTMPRDYSLKERLIRDIKSRISFKQVELVFTISKFSQEEVVKYYRVDPGKVKVIHLGVGPGFTRSDPREAADFRKKYHLGETPVIGFLGNMFRRRHVKETIEAFNLLKQEKEVRLFLVGKEYYNGELRDLLKSDGITWLERIDEREIDAFYSSLEVLVYLSDYEGFGFPPLEALQCGTVSLLLPTSSLLEVFKDIALFIDRPEPRLIKEQLKHILENRRRLEEEIFNRYKEKQDYYTWSRAAKEYLAFFS